MIPTHGPGALWMTAYRRLPRLFRNGIAGTPAEPAEGEPAPPGATAFRLGSLTLKNLLIFLVIIAVTLLPLVLYVASATEQQRIAALVGRLDVVAEEAVRRIDPALVAARADGRGGAGAAGALVAILAGIQRDFRIDNAILMRRLASGDFVYIADGNGQFALSQPVAIHDRFPETRRAAQTAWEERTRSNTELFGLGTYDYLQVHVPILVGQEVVALLLLNKFAEDVDQAIRTDLWRLALLTLALLSVGLSVFWLLSNRMLAPLARLRWAAERISHGDLSVELAPLRGRDEVTHLNESFRAMVRDLRESREALRRNNHELKHALARVQMMEDLERKLSEFVPAAVGKALRSDPEAMERGRSERDVSVLFLDIEGSALLAEALAGDRSNQLIENYFSHYLDHIINNCGDINETAGDGLMILFQDDDPCRHVANAIRTAAAIQDTTASINCSRPADQPELRINIGIGTGMAQVGFTRFASVGGTRMTYSASGRTTILAARLQALATGGSVLIGETGWRRVADTNLLAELRWNARQLGPKPLKNLSVPEPVTELYPSYPPAPCDPVPPETDGALPP